MSPVSAAASTTARGLASQAARRAVRRAEINGGRANGSAYAASTSTTRRGGDQAAQRWPHRSPPLTQPQANGGEAGPQQAGRLAIDEAHFEPMGSWSTEKLESSQADNPFMLTWAPGKIRDDIPHLSHGEGIYLVDHDGNRFIDWTSQAVCTNLGHDLPESVVEAAADQMRRLPYLYGGLGIQEVRTRLNQLMGEILPGDLRAALYPSSGSEANEGGIMMARRFTGRSKVLSFYRGYHGATANALSTTGDFRRWYGGERNSGFVKAFNPFPLFWDWAGQDEGERTQMALNMLEEQILNEGPEDIASIVLESVVGAGGCLVYPPGYLQGVRAICDEYGILMHCDEVMVGFGRTGQLFGFQHYEEVLPDIVSAAKGISASSVPLSMTACSKEIMDFFEDKPLGYGSTYQAHAVAMACAYENIKYMIKEDVLGHVQRLAPVFEENMRMLYQNHDSIKQFRSVGLFGCLDVHQMGGGNPRLQHQQMDVAFGEYKKAYRANGLIGLHRYPHLHVAPPLIITEDGLLEGFDRHDNALYTLDGALGYPYKYLTNDDGMDSVASG